MALPDESDLSSNGPSAQYDPCPRTARCGDRFNGLLGSLNQPLGDGGVSQIHVQIDVEISRYEVLLAATRRRNPHAPLFTPALDPRIIADGHNLRRRFAPDSLFEGRFPR